MQRRSRSPSRSLVQAMADRKGMYSFILLALISFTNAQSQSCSPITISDLGSTTSFSNDGLVPVGLVPPGEAVFGIPVRIMNYTIVCDTSGNRRDTSSYVSVVVQFQCSFSSTNPTLTICDGSTVVTRQYQFQCIDRYGQLVWDASVSGNTFFVQTVNPTATLSTPLANQCRRCIDDQQSSYPNNIIDDTTHCDPCGSGCNQGQGRCFIGPTGTVCCNFYLQGGCVAECPSALVADSNFDCVCSLLCLENGDVTYSPTNRDVGSVATHTCNSGYLLSPQGGETRTCTSNGWDGQNVTCELIQCLDLTVANGQITISPAGRPLGSRTTYECNHGFALVGDGDRICQEDSSWSGTNPVCTNCSQTLDDPNCEQCGIDLNNMTICTVCKTGYRLVGGQCQREERIQCPQITIANGSVTISPPGRLLGSRTTYICDEGFTLVGDGNRICQADSTWSGDEVECVPSQASAPDVQGLCSVVVWYSPEVSCEGISGYDVRLYSPQSVHRNVTRRVGKNGTFYIIKDEDNLAGNSDETYVQVRIIHYGRAGEWSEGISLGCEKPTVPEKPRVYFMLDGKVYRNNSAIPLTEIGEGDNALHCKTDKEECCGMVPNRFGKFYYPNGVRIPVARQQQGFYRSRGDQIIRLNRREGVTSPTGTYRCEIPNADDEMVTIYITLTGN